MVEPGAEYAAVCEELTEDLLGLVNVGTGESVINAVTPTESEYQRSEVDALPDLFLDWNHERPVETIWSAKTGLIHGRYDLWRTGDHRLDGMLLARGPGIVPGEKPALRSIDFGSTLAARLGVELANVDGEPATWLATRNLR